MRTTHGTIGGCPVTIIELNAAQVQCALCGGWGFHEHFVWYYEEPCCSLRPDRGGATACKECHDAWAEWDDLMIQLAEARGLQEIMNVRFRPVIRR